MQRRGFFQRAAVAATMLSPVAAPTEARSQAAGGAPAGAEPLDTLLRPYLASYGLPALAAAVVREGRVAAAGAVGTRRAGADIPVTLEDRFHIGSDTKAMAALLAAMQVEAGRLRWDSTLSESIPELAAGMDAGLRRVTLAQLLSHSSGVPSDNPAFLDLLMRSYTASGDDHWNLNEIRLWLVRQWSTQPLAAEPGTRFAYANMNYVFAGAMIERVAGRTWEELMVERIFEPLGLRTAGLGPQARPGRVDAPLGPAVRANGMLKPMLAGPDSDGPLVLGPAGLVHLSVLDFAAWSGWSVGEGRRGPALVRPETLRLLHAQHIAIPPRPDAAPGTPREGGGYGLGWGVARLDYAPEPVLLHSGSNTLNLATIMLQPVQDFAMVMVTNVGGRRAEAALAAVAEALWSRFGAARPG